MLFRSGKMQLDNTVSRKTVMWKRRAHKMKIEIKPIYVIGYGLV